MQQDKSGLSQQNVSADVKLALPHFDGPGSSERDVSGYGSLGPGRFREEASRSEGSVRAG